MTSRKRRRRIDPVPEGADYDTCKRYVLRYVTPPRLLSQAEEEEEAELYALHNEWQQQFNARLDESGAF
jgi:hypothetical protein